MCLIVMGQLCSSITTDADDKAREGRGRRRFTSIYDRLSNRRHTMRRTSTKLSSKWIFKASCCNSAEAGNIGIGVGFLDKTVAFCLGNCR